MIEVTLALFGKLIVTEGCKSVSVGLHASPPSFAFPLPGLLLNVIRFSSIIPVFLISSVHSPFVVVIAVLVVIELVDVTTELVGVLIELVAVVTSGVVTAVVTGGVGVGGLVSQSRSSSQLSEQSHTPSHFSLSNIHSPFSQVYSDVVSQGEGVVTTEGVVVGGGEVVVAVVEVTGGGVVVT